MNRHLSPFSAHLSRPPNSLPRFEDLGQNANVSEDCVDSRPTTPLSSQLDDEGDDEDDDEMLNQFPMINGPQRVSSAASSTCSSDKPAVTTKTEVDGGQKPSIRFAIPDNPSGVRSNAVDSAAPSRIRKKVPLEPGHSTMDWAKLKASGADMRGGIAALKRYVPSELTAHKTREDCWMAISGRVYNVSQYMKFHPGGQAQLMRGAGKDATELFFKVHPWVNHDYILGDKCLVGYLLPEPSSSSVPPGSSTSASPEKNDLNDID